MQRRVLIIAPTYNEVHVIETFIQQVKDILSEVDILIIDDNSPDQTAEKVKQLTPLYKGILLLERSYKQGLKSAYFQGFEYALEHGYDYIITMDVDLSHDPCSLPQLLNQCHCEAQSAEAIPFVVIGSPGRHCSPNKIMNSIKGRIIVRV